MLWGKWGRGSRHQDRSNLHNDVLVEASDSTQVLEAAAIVRKLKYIIGCFLNLLATSFSPGTLQWSMVPQFHSSLQNVEPRKEQQPFEASFVCLNKGKIRRRLNFLPLSLSLSKKYPFQRNNVLCRSSCSITEGSWSTRFCVVRISKKSKIFTCCKFSPLASKIVQLEDIPYNTLRCIITTSYTRARPFCLHFTQGSHDSTTEYKFL